MTDANLECHHPVECLVDGHCGWCAEVQHLYGSLMALQKHMLDSGYTISPGTHDLTVERIGYLVCQSGSRVTFAGALGPVGTLSIEAGAVVGAITEDEHA